MLFAIPALFPILFLTTTPNRQGPVSAMLCPIPTARG